LSKIDINADRFRGRHARDNFYTHDASGSRIRKVTERYAAPGATPTVKSQRVYIRRL
jgi:hypothetical protein